MIKFIIPGKLLALNEYINLNRTNCRGANKVKQSVEADIIKCIKRDLKNISFSKPVYIKIYWIEPNKMRDKDNIAFAKKFILDALVKAGVIKGDGWAFLEGFTDEFSVDKVNPRVEVEIKAVG